MARIQEQIQTAADDEEAEVSATFCIFICCTEVLYYKQWNVTVCCTEFFGNSKTKSLAYMSLVRPILEYGASCWDPYRGGTNSCVRQGAKESGQICTSYEQFELGKFGVA
jgi:hypothetical protein